MIISLEGVSNLGGFCGLFVLEVVEMVVESVEKVAEKIEKAVNDAIYGGPPAEPGTEGPACDDDM